MTTALERALLDGFTTLLIDNFGIKDVAKVTAYEEKYVEMGYCDTCYDSWTEVEITYDRINGGQGEYTYYGYLQDLIAKLTQ